MRARPPWSEDSEFDWDAHNARVAASRQAAHRAAHRTSGTDWLAWGVVVALTFCPVLGYLLATLW